MDNQLKTIAVYNQYVTAYEQKFMNFDLYNDTFDAVLEKIPTNSNVLELGCGPGNVIKYFLNKRTDLKITGIDLAPEMIKRAQEINPSATFRLMDIRHANDIENQFELVIGAFCLPYLPYGDLPTFFQQLNSLTLKNGFIYLSCMEGEREKSGFEKTSFTGDCEMYIYYHQRSAIEDLLSQNGFQIEHFYTKDYPETDGTVTKDVIYIAKKG
jgi:cyclopropane fatty-acyl-phospholipid synthase-like methyltransferase